MAVPFSRPLYPGGPPRRVGPPRRGRQHYSQRHTTHQTHQPDPVTREYQRQYPNPAASTSGSQQNNNQHQHPIARFLYGDGVIQLDRLNRVTRLAFFALYEAWRLLQDLSPNRQNQPRSITQNEMTTNQRLCSRTIPTSTQAPVLTQQQLTVVDVSNANEQRREERKNLPDVVLEARDSTQQSNVNYQHNNLNIITHHQQRQPTKTLNGESMFETEATKICATPASSPGKQILLSSSNRESSNRHHQQDNEIIATSSTNNRSCNTGYPPDDQNEEILAAINKIEQKIRHRHDAEANPNHIEKNRQFIDDQGIRMRNIENTIRSRLRRSSFSTSALPDLIPISDRGDESFHEWQSNLTNCHYSMQQRHEDNDIDHIIDQIDFGHFDDESGYTAAPWDKQKCFIDNYDDDDDGDDYGDDMMSDGKKSLYGSTIVSPTTTTTSTIASYPNDCPWSNSGLVLIELASAFEMSYGVTFENEEQRQQYELYKRMKADVLRNQARYFYGNNENNIFGMNIFELGKAVLSQALLTGMWFMLKRIKLV